READREAAGAEGQAVQVEVGAEGLAGAGADGRGGGGGLVSGPGGAVVRQGLVVGGGVGQAGGFAGDERPRRDGVGDRRQGLQEQGGEAGAEPGLAEQRSKGTSRCHVALPSETTAGQLASRLTGALPYSAQCDPALFIFPTLTLKWSTGVVKEQ